MVDWLLSSITFLGLISMESAWLLSGSNLLMHFSGACFSTTPTPGVWYRLLISIWNICNPLCGSMNLLWNWKCESPPLSSMSEMVRSESLFYSSSIYLPRLLRTCSLLSWACLSLTCLTYWIWFTCWFLNFRHPDSYRESPCNFFGNGMLGDLYWFSCINSCLSRYPCRSVHNFYFPCRPFERIPLFWCGWLTTRFLVYFSNRWRIIWSFSGMRSSPIVK